MKITAETGQRKTDGFTLIELLIVIGLLGALAAMVLPKLSASRTAALSNVDAYDGGGTARTLSTFHQLTEQYPNALHTGLNTNTVSAAWTLSGMPKRMSKTANPMVSGAIAALTAEEAASLTEAGIDTVCFDYGLNATSVTNFPAVLKPSKNMTAWTFAGTGICFDGVSLADLIDEDGDGTAEYSLVMLYITPTADWAVTNNGNSDWGEGQVALSLDLPSQFTHPSGTATGDKADFVYYAAWFKLDLAGVKAAELVGVTNTGGVPWNLF